MRKCCLTLSLFQSTFPRGERLQYMASDNEDVPFQSTFPRGERRSLWIVIRLVFDDFNPRSLVGNDQEFEITQSRIVISIHVPSWGTTDRSSPETATTTFQSTFPRGERQCRKCKRNSKMIFQSTFPRGERPIGKSRWADGINFNPRSLVGNDGKFSQIFFVFLCNKYNFSTFYYPFSLFFSVIHVTFLIFVVRILPAFYVYF